MSKIKEAQSRLGELFLMGVPGVELTPETSKFIQSAQIGGVIFFAHNYDSPGQLIELVAQIQECRSDLPLWISVDHEGGRVQRFKKGFTKIPEASILGALDSAQMAYEVSDLMARELKAVGINLNFFPLADINTNPKNPVIGNRAYGADEELVSKMVSAAVRGHLLQNVQPCLKHFPGHGDTKQDSHYALPSVDTPFDVLREREFKPFLKGFKSKCNFLMTAHVIIKSLDPEVPSTLSKKILQDILRRELRYNGVIVSDDMEMQAITDHFGATDAPRLAIQAGCNLLIYRTEKAARIAYEALSKALQDGTLDPHLVLESAERSRALKKQSLLPYTAPKMDEIAAKIGTAANAELIAKITEQKA